jgi:hypothetical protein
VQLWIIHRAGSKQPDLTWTCDELHAGVLLNGQPPFWGVGLHASLQACVGGEEREERRKMRGEWERRDNKGRGDTKRERITKDY